MPAHICCKNRTSDEGRNSLNMAGLGRASPRAEMHNNNSSAVRHEKINCSKHRALGLSCAIKDMLSRQVIYLPKAKAYLWKYFDYNRHNETTLYTDIDHAPMKCTTMFENYLPRTVAYVSEMSLNDPVSRQANGVARQILQIL